VRSRALVAVMLACALATACEREHRPLRVPPQANGPAAEAAPSFAELDVDTVRSRYDGNRWGVSEGGRLYAQFNCAGCHASAGGGGMGPPLRDSVWLYGSAPGAIYATIEQGRPNGMPAFGRRAAPDDIWKLVAFVRSLSELTPADTWSARNDDMAAANPRRAAPPADLRR
jgi:cytochrome c oxidase cbb3-type subunit III